MAKHLAAAKEKSDSPLIKQVAEGRGTGFGLTSSSAEVEAGTLESLRSAAEPAAEQGARRARRLPRLRARARALGRGGGGRRRGGRGGRDREDRGCARAGLIGVATGLRQTARPPAELYLRAWPSAKPVERVDRVIIRFAGDSGDGMQLTGDRFTSETAMLGNDLSTLPDFPAEIRAPAGSLPGVSGFQVHFADHDILTPGDRPNVLVAMNPAALKTNLDDLPRGGTLIVNKDAFNERNLQKAGYEANPLEDGSLDDYHVHEVALTTMTVEALKEHRGAHVARGRALEELLRARADVVALPPPDRGHARVRREEVRQAARDRRGERDRVQGRLRLRRDLRGLRRLVRGRAREAAARDVPPDRRQHGALVRPDRRLEALEACRSSSAPTRSRPRPRSSRSWRATSASACARSRPRTRSRPRARRSARPSAARSASRVSAGPGHRAQVRDDRPRRRARAAARDPRHPARRPLDRDADEARAGRPADGAVRPELGEPGAGDRRLDAVAVLPRRDRGGADRAQVPHARLPAQRRVPRERLRAVADPGRRRPARRSRPSSRPTRRASSRTRATRRRSRGRGRSPARPGSSTGSAASRRRTAPATSPTTPTTTT